MLQQLIPRPGANRLGAGELPHPSMTRGAGRLGSHSEKKKKQEKKMFDAY